MDIVTMALIDDTRPDRRSRPDRRENRTTFLDVLRPGGQRRFHRRRGEGRRTYVDRLPPRVLGMLLFLLVASAADAFLTLLHFSIGGEEANPLMEMAIDCGVGFFVGLKMGITALGVLCLAAHQLFPLGGISLRVLCLGYALLLGYHGLLVTFW